MEQIIYSTLFYTFSAAAVVSAIFVVIRKNPVASAMNLVVTFFSISGIYILLNSQFIAVMQILIYAGAIMVLIIFVIMLLNLRSPEKDASPAGTSRGAAIAILLLVMTALLVTVIIRGEGSGVRSGITNTVIDEKGSIQVIAGSMFTQYLLPFELVSVLITIAIIGAVILSQGGRIEKRIEEEK